MTVLQGTFADVVSEPRLEQLDGQVERTLLSAGAWCDLRRSWVSGSDALFATLEERVEWQHEERWMYDRVVDVPRLVRHYQEHEALPDPLLEQARKRLSRFYANEQDGPFVSTGMCLYRDGRDSVAWHGDRIGRGENEDVCVAIVSLGARRRFLLRPRSGGSSLRFDLGRGDLLVMGGSCQRTWDHAVPKSQRVEGARISVQFRPLNTR